MVRAPFAGDSDARDPRVAEPGHAAADDDDPADITAKLSMRIRQSISRPMLDGFSSRPCVDRWRPLKDSDSSAIGFHRFHHAFGRVHDLQGVAV